MPREGVGVVLGAHVRHMVTYRDPLRGPYFTPFLPSTVKNVQKGEYPLFLIGFELAAHLVYTRGGSSKSFVWPIRQLLAGHKHHF